MRKQIEDIDFRDVMYGYAMETTHNATTLHIFIPDITPDKTLGDPINNPLFPSAKVFQNDITISTSVNETNYLTLRMIYPKACWDDNGIVNKGQRVLLNFVNGHPTNGYIIGLA